MYVCVYVCVRVSAASPAVAADVTPSHSCAYLQCFDRSQLLKRNDWLTM